MDGGELTGVFATLGEFSISAPTLANDACFGWKLSAAVPQPPISTLARPMAPQSRSNAKFADGHHGQQGVISVQENGNGAEASDELFLEPMMGTPLAIYIEKDVQDRDNLVEIITVRARQT